MEGELWFRIPEVILLRSEGSLQEGVSAKDVSLFILGQLGTDFANYKVIEFAGTIVDNTPVEERQVLTNMAVEMGAKSSYIQPDVKTLAYIKARTGDPFTVYETDPDYHYESNYVYNLDDLEPQVACPAGVDDAHKVSQVAGIPIDQVFLGSCTGGRLTDIAAAAGILEGKRVAKGTRLIVTAASKESPLTAAATAIMGRLTDPRDLTRQRSRDN